MKIIVDNKVYKTKSEAMKEFKAAIWGCEGSERDRMMFAYDKIQNGFDIIDTYAETATKSKKEDSTKLLNKMHKEINGAYFKIFKNWAKGGFRTLDEIVSDYIVNRYGVSNDDAMKYAEILIKENL